MFKRDFQTLIVKFNKRIAFPGGVKKSPEIP